ncbi:hypothetical protein D3C81_742340 [compost metagenome]
MLERTQRTQHIIHQRKTLGAAAKVGIHRLGQRFVVRHQHVDHPLDPRAAGHGSDSPLSVECSLLFTQQGRQRVDGRICTTHWCLLN